MKRTLRDVCVVNSYSFIFFVFISAFTKGTAYVIHAIFYALFFLVFLSLFYLVFVFAITLISEKFKEIMQTRHESLMLWLLKYRILVFMNLLFYGYLLLFSFYHFHRLFFRDPSVVFEVIKYFLLYIVKTLHI